MYKITQSIFEGKKILAEIVENVLKFCLEKYSYRCEFYTCEITIIENALSNICNFMKKQNNNFIFEKNSIQKLYKKIKVILIILLKQARKRAKKTSKKQAKNKQKNKQENKQENK